MYFKLLLYFKSSVRDKKTQSILIICGFCVCEFTYSLKLICNPKIKNSWTFCNHSQTCMYTEQSTFWVTFQLRLNKMMLCLLVSAHMCKQESFSWSVQCHLLFYFLCFLLIVLRCCLMLLSTRRLWCALWRKYCVR